MNIIHKKIITATFLVFTLPLAALAAYNDVTLTTSAIVHAGGVDFNVSGSSAVIQSITVNASDFTVTLASGSSITISQPGLFEIKNDMSSDVTGSVCSSATSSLSLGYSGAGTVTNTISASSTSCSTATPGAPTSVSATAGNAQATVSFTAPSQGGSPITNYTVTSSPGSITATGSASPITVTGLANGTAYTFTIVAANSSGNGPASAASNQVTPSAPSSPTSASVSGGTVSSQTLAGLLAPSASTTAYLRSLGITAPAAGTASAAPSSNVAPSYRFTADLTVGSIGPDVKALQIWLNGHGYAVASSGPGSPGHETDLFGAATRAALARFQKANSISPAAGYFGPLTMSAINALGGAVQANPSAVPSGTTFTRDLTVGFAGPDVKALQQYLNSHGHPVASYGPGSPGNETDTFGLLTKTALAAFQKAKGISPAVGYFGPITRKYVAANP